MTIALHHFFILTDPGAPHANLLRAVGLTEGPCNEHRGQGTANRRFFFSNTTLELLYISDVHEVTNGRARRLRFAERSASIDASPFGIIVNTLPGSVNVPFPSWPYCPEYFTANQCFHVGDNSELLDEPLCICMPFDLPLPKVERQLSNSQMNLTEMRIGVPINRPSPTLETFGSCEPISLRLNEPHRLDLVFNDGNQGFYKDLTPDLPLTIRW